MDDEQRIPESRERRPPSRGWGLPLLVILLACTSAFSLAYLVRERRHTMQLDTRNQELSVNLGQVKGQLQALSDKLNMLSAPPQAPAAATESVPHARSATRARPRAAGTDRRRQAEDSRLKNIQSQLSKQEQAIAETRSQVEKTREDLQGSLSSTRDELNGSIARTHEELVALEKRGERNYHEFQLPKSKQFQRVGPISLSLRKTNFKHKFLDLMMIVDDFQLSKKHVNLYEPVLVYLNDRPQPVELVVNRISKDQVQGYLSEPKYKKSELVAKVAAQGTAESPAPTH